MQLDMNNKNQNNEITILCLGNSHTGGYPGHHREYGGDVKSTYQYWLLKKWEKLDNKNLPSLQLLNHGVNGDTLSGMKTRLRQQLEHFKAKFDLVLLMGGSNDLTGYYSTRSFDKLLAQIKSMYDLLKSHSKGLILSSIPPGGEDYDFPTDLASIFQKYNQKLQTWAQEQDIAFISIQNVLGVERGEEQRMYLNPKYDLNDGLHLSKMGYKQLGYYFADRLAEILLDRLE